MQKQYDKFEQLAFDGKLTIAIMGNPQTRDFEMVDVASLPLPECVRHNLATERGMFFIGVVAMVDGCPKAAMDFPLDDAAVDLLSAEYVRRIEGRVNASLEVQCLEAMYRQKDTRPN